MSHLYLYSTAVFAGVMIYVGIAARFRKLEKELRELKSEVYGKDYLRFGGCLWCGGTEGELHRHEIKWKGEPLLGHVCGDPCKLPLKSVDKQNKALQNTPIVLIACLVFALSQFVVPGNVIARSIAVCLPLAGAALLAFPTFAYTANAPYTKRFSGFKAAIWDIRRAGMLVIALSLLALWFFYFYSDGEIGAIDLSAL